MTNHHDQPKELDHIELPAPTASPLITAFGMTLMATGIVTNWTVAVVGVILLLAGAVRWFCEVHPDSHEIDSPVLDDAPEAIEARMGKVAHLAQDTAHRARWPVEIHPYSAGATGGLIGGACMAAFAVAWGLITQGSLWYSVNLLAGAMLSGYAEMSVEELSAFHTGGLIAGAVIQVLMSLFIGLLYGVLLPLLPRFPMTFAAIIIPLIWSGLFWASMTVTNPALGEHVNWIWFIASQVIFGLVTGWWVMRSEKIGTMQNWSYLERLGIESPGVREMGGDQE